MTVASYIVAGDTCTDTGFAEQVDADDEPMAWLAARGQSNPRDVAACRNWNNHRWHHREQSVKWEPPTRGRGTREEGRAAGGAGTA